jgi:hypothetical protein
MRKFEVTTHEDDQHIEAHYMKILKDNQERPTYILFTKVNDHGEGTSTVAIFNFASVVSVIDITDRVGSQPDMFIRRINSQTACFDHGAQ